jgi:hypothetical protein
MDMDTAMDTETNSDWTGTWRWKCAEWLLKKFKNTSVPLPCDCDICKIPFTKVKVFRKILPHSLTQNSA